MERFLTQYSSRIAGVVSGFDRLLFRGTLRSISFVDGMERICRPSIRGCCITPSSTSPPATCCAFWAASCPGGSTARRTAPSCIAPKACAFGTGSTKPRSRCTTKGGVSTGSHSDAGLPTCAAAPTWAGPPPRPPLSPVASNQSRRSPTLPHDPSRRIHPPRIPKPLRGRSSHALAPTAPRARIDQNSDPHARLSPHRQRTSRDDHRLTLS
jgi:hypothetical protein